MKHRCKLFFVFLMVAIMGHGCDNQQETATPANEKTVQQSSPKRIVALGDSLTAGLGVDPRKSYPALVQKRLEEDGYDFRVVNAGVSGETSSGTLSRLDWILGQEPKIVILVIGANDGLRGIDTAHVESNIDAILLRLKANDIVTVLAGMKMVRNLGEDYTRRFDAIYPRLAEKHEVIFMPFFLKDVAGIASLNSDDGIHPNEQGYMVIADNIYPYVLRAVEKLPDAAPQ
jgi:acyl-CoA thioesterase-1